MRSGTPSIKDQILASLSDKAYREALVEESINQGIAFQIRANRIKREWTQGDLGRLAGKAQSEVSRLEDPDYEGYTLKTLTKLAAAFDVALAVRFVPFSALADDMSNEHTRDFAVPSFQDDPGLRPRAKPQLGMQMSMSFPYITNATTQAAPLNVILMAAHRQRPQVVTTAESASAPSSQEGYEWHSQTALVR